MKYKNLFFSNQKLFIVIFVISFLFALLDGSGNFDDIESVFEAISFNMILAYLAILPVVVLEKYIQIPTEKKVKKYFILSSLVSLLVIFVFTLLIFILSTISSIDGFGALVVFVAPFYIIPIVFVYTFLRMLLWYKFNISTDKIMHLKYYFLAIVIIFFLLAFGGLEIIQKTAIWELVTTPINSLFDFLYNQTQCILAGYCI